MDLGYNYVVLLSAEEKINIPFCQEHEDPTLTEWDRFAHREYIRLSMEEDVEDASNASDVWDESLEAPF